jgi:hypothetical protein
MVLHRHTIFFGYSWWAMIYVGVRCRSPQKHQSVPAGGVQSSLCPRNLDAFAEVGVPFPVLTQINAILLQVFLHIIQGFFVRGPSSERDVNTVWKQETCLCISQVDENCSWLYCGQTRKVHWLTLSKYLKKKITEETPMLLFRKRAIPTERWHFIAAVSPNFC